MYLKLLFIICAILLCSLLILYKLVISKRKRTEKTAAFISFMGAMVFLYVLSGILLSIFIPNIINKLIIALFAISPFIIGKFATYEKESFYSFLQIFCIITSTIYCFIV